MVAAACTAARLLYRVRARRADAVLHVRCSRAREAALCLRGQKDSVAPDIFDAICAETGLLEALARYLGGAAYLLCNLCLKLVGRRFTPYTLLLVFSPSSPNP